MTKLLPNSIQGRLILALFTSLLAIVVLGSCLIFYSSTRYQSHVTQVMHKDLAKYIAEHYTFEENGILNLDKIKHAFHNLMIMGPNVEFYVLDNTGNVIAYSADKSKIKRNKISLQPVYDYINSNALTTPIFGENPRSTEGNKVFSAYPIIKDDNHIGYIYAILGSDIYDETSNILFENKLIQWGFAILLLGLAFWFAALLWITGLIVNPLNTLSRQIYQVYKSGFTKETIQEKAFLKSLNTWNKNSKNEIHVLGNGFKLAIEKLSEQYEKAVTIDELRKELLSHISHDLRTPLASMLGYLETWELKQNDLTPEESAQYIATAKDNAKKISTLIEQLFELAYLDSGNVQVNREKFALAELIQDVIVKFDIPAKKKNVIIHVEPKDASIMVHGDIEKLDRVFTNLLENAMRHTKEGGEICVRLNKKISFVSVEVSDTGIGIPEKDIPHIFEPHFKAGNSVRENTAHGGLGLAITKKLLSLHQATINVKSRVNQGTTFAFSLPVEA